MCRWVAYMGSPLALDEVIVKSARSLVHQSRHAREGAEAMNGDGFGIGWYGDAPEPGLFRSIGPAWNDRNLLDVARLTRSGLFFGHIRASTGTTVQQTNCHPFRHGRWLWMHNGLIRDFVRIKRELTLAVDPALYPFIEGSTDSELMFYLALTFGLQNDPPTAVARMVGYVETLGRRHGTEHPVQMTVATSDGRSIWAFRYSSEGSSRSLYYTSAVPTLRAMYPEVAQFAGLSEHSRLIVSEPLGELTGVWNAAPESSFGVVSEERSELGSFGPLT